MTNASVVVDMLTDPCICPRNKAIKAKAINLSIRFLFLKFFSDTKA